MINEVKSETRLFRADLRGTVALVFAASAAILIMGIAVAVDIGRSTRAHSVLQKAADAASIAGASYMGATIDQRIAAATQVFQTNATKAGINATPVVSMEPNSRVVAVEAEASVPTTFAKIGGFNEIDISVRSAASLPQFQGEVVFVLDYSSSMTSGDGTGQEKWQSMRDASVDLINRLLNGEPNPYLKVGLVPFAREVYLSLPGEHVLGGTAGTTWTNCTVDRRHPYVAQDSTPVSSSPETQWGRTDGDDIIAADEYDDCNNYASRNLIVRPLSTDHSAVLSQLNAMVPYSGTNISAGMSVGWHVISPNEPFSEGEAYGSESKTVILLTDGDQTVPSFGPGASYNDQEGEFNLEQMCVAMKAQGVRIITVAYSTDVGSATRNRLQNCASAGHFYYEPEDGAELAKAFQDMAYRIGGSAHLVD